MSSTEFDEKTGERILPRHEFESRIKIEIVRGLKTLCTEGWARDMSESGLGAFVGAKLLVGEVATLRIPLTGQTELVIPAIVTRNLGTQYGFRFTALSKTQREQLCEVLAHCRVVPYRVAGE